MKRLLLTFENEEALARDHAQNLALGRAFVNGVSGVEDRDACELEIVHPTTNAAIILPAEVVWITPNGVGVALTSFDAQAKQALALFVEEPVELIPASEPQAMTESDPPVSSPPQTTSSGTLDLDLESELQKSTRSSRPHALNPHEKVRHLSGREREDLARRGNTTERVALERAFGNQVWDALLSNPGLTLPEVARIAKNGGIPRPLVGTIVGNGGWIASPEVQRALLSNPRCGGQHLDRVLRAMRPNDLQQLAQQCPYRSEVKSAAQKLAKANR